MKRLISIGVLLLLVVGLTACGASIDPNTPPEIVYGEDVCAHCGMIISDARFAAGVVVEREPDHYEHLIFDDIGDMFAYLQEETTHSPIASYFVHDYHSKAWIDARTAHFVRADALHTPMGSGLAAFQDRPAAEALAQELEGDVLTFESAQEQLVHHDHMNHVHTQ